MIWLLLQEGLTTYLLNPVLPQSIFKLLKEVENEVVPGTERGKYIIGTFHDFECYPDKSCGGTQEDWTKVVIYTNAGETGAWYAEVKWNRDECGQKAGIH